MLNLKKFLEEIVKIKKQVIAAKESGQKIMAFFGWTGSGKSTSLNIIMGADVGINEEQQLDVKQGSVKYVEIGHDTKVSCTLYPALVENGPGGYAFFDTAGVMDDRGPEFLTESAIAACSLPILLNDSHIHGIFLVISKDFLERTGKSSFSELIDSLRSLVDLEHDKIQRKIFFILTKTIELGPLKLIDDLIAKLPENLKSSSIAVKKAMLANSSKEVRRKLDACKNSDDLDHLIDTREKYGNVFILRGDGEDDVKYLKIKLMRCKLIRSVDKPDLSTLNMINAGAAYVRWKDKLFYLSKFEDTCDLLDVSKDALEKFDQLTLLTTSLPEKNGVKNLTPEQLNSISEIIRHSHLRVIMKPIPKEVFTLHNPITKETKFTKLRTRVESVDLDTNFSQHKAILKFKTALVNTIEAYNFIITKAIHLPNLDLVCGIELQKACLELISCYNRADIRVFPDYLKTLKNQLAEFSQLIPEFCEGAEELSQYFTDMANELENMFALPPLTAQMMKIDQIQNSKNALSMINTISPGYLTALNNIYDKSDDDHLYWQQLLNCYATVSRDPNNTVYNNFIQNNPRTENLKNTLNTFATFSHNAVDDACISTIAHFLLELRKNYTTALYSPIKTPILPLANNLSLFSHAILAMVDYEENNLQQQLDPFTIYINKINENLASFATTYMDFINNPAAIFDRLFTDYYQCLADIKRTQDAYMTQYQTTLANGVNLIAGSQPYINTFNGRGAAATLNIPGGGRLNNYIAGNIDATLLAAEALSLLSFSVGTPQKNNNVQGLVLDRRDFCSEIFSTTNETHHNKAGGISGNKFFGNQNAEWECIIPLQVSNNQQAYSVRIYKNYEHFKVKAAFLKYWDDAPYSGNGENSPSPPGQFLTDFGGYSFDRRRPPYFMHVNMRGDGDAYYHTEANGNYNSQTATLEQELRRAIQEYIDIQSSSTANRALSWCFDNQPIALSTLNSTTTLTNQSLITNARADVDTWFINHRNALINCFNTHTAAAGTSACQNLLDERKNHLINLDITVALIKLFAKLYGKSVNNNFFINLITTSHIAQDISNINNLAVTDASPSINTAYNNTHSTNRDLLATPDDFQSRFLHPRTLINYLTPKAALHHSLLKIRDNLPSFNQTYPKQALKIIDYLQSLPSDCHYIKIQHRELNALDIECLAIALRERKTYLRKLKLRATGLSEIGSLIQACTQLQELDISLNSLTEKSLTDVSLLLALNPSLNKLNLSADLKNKPFILSTGSALELLAALYLNRHLKVLIMDNIACEEPIILQVIHCIMAFKHSSDNTVIALNEAKYFSLLNKELDDFLIKHPHPMSVFDKRDNLFKDKNSDQSLHSKIDALRKALKDRGQNFEVSVENTFSSSKANYQDEKTSFSQKDKSSFSAYTFNKESSHRAAQQKKIFNQASVEQRDGLEIAKNYWYEDIDMNHILQAALEQHGNLTPDRKPISIIGPLDNISPYGLLQALRAHNRKAGLILIPYNIGNLHWVGLVMEYDENGNLIRADHYDSLGAEVRSYLNEILKSVSQTSDKVKSFTNITSTQGLIRQQNGDDCGPCTIANLLACVGYPEDKIVDAVDRRLRHLQLLDKVDNIFYQSFYERQRLNQSFMSFLNKSTQIASAKVVSNSAGSNLMSIEEYSALLELTLDILKLQNEEFKTNLVNALAVDKDVTLEDEHRAHLIRIRSVFAGDIKSKDSSLKIAERIFYFNKDGEVNIMDAPLKLDWNQLLALNTLLALSQIEIEEDIAEIIKYKNNSFDTATKKGVPSSKTSSQIFEKFNTTKKSDPSVLSSTKSMQKTNGGVNNYSYTSFFKMDNSSLPQKAHKRQQQFTLLKDDKITVEDIEKHCHQSSIDIKNSVFIFPGNPSHHQNNSLFQVKSGAGLASLADSLGQNDIACLSLPTAYLENLSTTQLNNLKSNAVADIWRAVGFEMSILLPVRHHVNQTYFTQSIKLEDKLFEPKFWGGIVNNANRELGDYYVRELNRIREFIASKDKQQILQKMLQQPQLKPFYDAYQEGVEAIINLKDNNKQNPWFKRNISTKTFTTK